MNEAQQKAVLHKEGPMLVLAGPGSGKTFTITNRISYLITQQEILPERILVITFTKEAALSMQERFFKTQNQLDNAAFGTLPVYFGTFHATFYQILKQSCKGITDNILRDSEKKKLILPIVIDFKKNIERNKADGLTFDNYEDADNLLSAISYYKNTGNQEKAANKLQSPWKEGFLQLRKSYELARKASGKLDFDDMVYGCLNLLQKNKELLKYWQERFSYILIDEFQDINPIQYQVIKLLAGTKGNLFCVGDDDQSIYGFRGSDPSLMKKFLEDYPQAKQVLLAVNYRSKESIVQASLNVICQNKNRFSKELKAFQTEELYLEKNKVQLLGFLEKEIQYQYLIEKLKKQNGGFLLEQTAVLFRTNLQMQGFASKLAKAGVAYSMKEKSTCIYEHFISKDIKNYIQFAIAFVVGKQKRANFLTIMNKPSRGIQREALTEEKVDFEKVKAYYDCYLTSSKAYLMKQTLTKLERELKQLAGMKPYMGVQFIRRKIGYEQYLCKKAGIDRNKKLEWIEMLEWLTEDAKSYPCYQDWFAYQDAFQEKLEQTMKKASQKKGVRLMTIHASKGLEFDKVYLPDLNEGMYPYGKAMDLDNVEEERRLLYVAMTRAKEALELFFVTGTKEQPKLPSRFLQPLFQTEHKKFF